MRSSSQIDARRSDIATRLARSTELLWRNRPKLPTPLAIAHRTNRPVSCTPGINRSRSHRDVAARDVHAFDQLTKRLQIPARQEESQTADGTLDATWQTVLSSPDPHYNADHFRLRGGQSSDARGYPNTSGDRSR